MSIRDFVEPARLQVPDENGVAALVMDACIRIHRAWGPGLLESVYEQCLEYELVKEGLRVERQVGMRAKWKGISLEQAFRADMLINDIVIVELKAMEGELKGVHRRQLLTYLKVSGRKLGLLINFGGERLVDGFERVANGL